MTAAIEGGEWSAARPGRTLSPGKNRYQLYRRLRGPQGRSGRAENLVSTGIRSRNVQPVAQSLYRLSYRALNPLNAELNPICHLLALLGARHILHVSRIRVKLDSEILYGTVESTLSGSWGPGAEDAR